MINTQMQVPDSPLKYLGQDGQENHHVCKISIQKYP